MAFPRRLLHETEDVVLDLSPHWWSLAGPGATLAGLVVAGIVAMTKGWPAFFDWVLGLGLVAAAGWFGWRYAVWSTTNFVVTTDRLIFRHGVLSKHGIEIPLERVNNVIFSQTLFERILGAGDLLIESAGESGQQRFTDIPDPSGVQNEVYRQIEANEQRTVARINDGRDAASIPEQIEKLDELRRRGILTDDEFERKKKDLLDRM